MNASEIDEAVHFQNEVVLAGATKLSDAYGYASRLLLALAEKHYPDRSPEFAPLPDLMGVLTQIDNLTTGLVREEDNDLFEVLTVAVEYLELAGVGRGIANLGREALSKAEGRTP